MKKYQSNQFICLPLFFLIKNFISRENYYAADIVRVSRPFLSSLFHQFMTYLLFRYRFVLKQFSHKLTYLLIAKIVIQTIRTQNNKLLICSQFYLSNLWNWYHSILSSSFITKGSRQRQSRTPTILPRSPNSHRSRKFILTHLSRPNNTTIVLNSLLFNWFIRFLCTWYLTNVIPFGHYCSWITQAYTKKCILISQQRYACTPRKWNIKVWILKLKVNFPICLQNYSWINLLVF